MPNEKKVVKVQALLQETRNKLKQMAIDKGGLTLSEIQLTVQKHLGWRAIWNSGSKDVWRTALRREGWERQRMSRRWFYVEKRVMRLNQ